MSDVSGTLKYHRYRRMYGKDASGKYIILEEIDLGIFEVPAGKDPREVIEEEVGEPTRGYTTDFSLFLE